MADSPLRPATPGGRRLQLSPVALPVVPEIDEVSVRGGVGLGWPVLGRRVCTVAADAPVSTALSGFFVLIVCGACPLPTTVDDARGLPTFPPFTRLSCSMS